MYSFDRLSVSFGSIRCPFISLVRMYVLVPSFVISGYSQILVTLYHFI
jgi:hypothetical protein